MNLPFPPHQPTDEEKIASMVESLRLNQKLPPVVTVGEQAITGSHRIAAASEAWDLWDREAPGWEDTEEPTLDVLELEDDEIEEILRFFDEEWLDLELIGYNEVVGAAYQVARDPRVKSALKDQLEWS